MNEQIIVILLCVVNLEGLWLFKNYLNNPERMKQALERQNIHARYGVVAPIRRLKITSLLLLFIVGMIDFIFYLVRAHGIILLVPTCCTAYVIYGVYQVWYQGKIRYTDDKEMLLYRWPRNTLKIQYDDIIKIRKEYVFRNAIPRFFDTGFDGDIMVITIKDKNQKCREITLNCQMYIGLDMFYSKIRTEIDSRRAYGE